MILAPVCPLLHNIGVGQLVTTNVALCPEHIVAEFTLGCKAADTVTVPLAVPEQVPVPQVTE